MQSVSISEQTRFPLDISSSQKANVKYEIGFVMLFKTGKLVCPLEITSDASYY